MQLSKKTVFGRGNADLISELPSTIKQYNKTRHHSIKMFPIEASKKMKEEILFDIIQDKREKQEPV